MSPLNIKPILVLAGGFGSRLKSVVSDVPKPLAPVCGRPFIIHLIENLIYQGAREMVILLHYRADLIQAVVCKYIERLYKNNINVTFIVEETPLGTGGSISNAVRCLKISDSFLVINSDTWLGNGLKDINMSSPNSISAIEVADCSRYGSIIAEGKEIKRFVEKGNVSGGGLINAGLYHLNIDLFSNFLDVKSFSLESDVFPLAVENGILKVIKINTDFIDIGIPEDYFRFCNWIHTDKKNAL
jgi:D-glycero-alpha-D-manno-heptose 1-phosphate guanylyltransferase